MKFPSIKAIASELVAINREISLEPEDVDEGCDIRLQVYPDGSWAIRVGRSDYDQDHRGYWGASSVPGDRKRFNSRDVARDLIEQARGQRACEVES